MSIGTFHDNPNYLTYLQQLLHLHEMIACGQGDSENADALRDEMDQPWLALTPPELDRTDILSADLYMLTGEEVYEKAEPKERSLERLGPRLKAAWERKDWDAVLALLRLGPDFLEPAQVAYLRGRCWEELGHADIALLFFDYAAGLHPQNGCAAWFEERQAV